MQVSTFLESVASTLSSYLKFWNGGKQNPETESPLGTTASLVFSKPQKVKDSL